MPNLEAFRIHLPYLFVFEKLIEFLNWEVSTKVKKHMHLTQAMLSLLNACKRNNSYNYYIHKK